MFSLNYPRLIHGIKTAIAILIGFIVTQFINFQVDQWLIISIIVVMCAQMNVGSILYKSYMRFLGTLTGSLIAGLCLTLFGQYFWTTAITVAISGLLFSYIATSSKSYNDAGTLGAATVAIILIGPDPSIMTAADRFLEISVGILIAAVVSQFLFPMHASRDLRNNQAQTLRLLRDYYRATLMAEDGGSHEILDEAISKLLIAQRKLATEAGHEPLRKSYKVKLFKQSLWDEKAILRCIRFMYHSYMSSHEMKKIFANSVVIKNFHSDICNAINTIAESMQNITPVKVTLPPIEPLKDTVDAASKVMQEQDVISAHTFLFCAETLVAELQNLKILVTEMNEAD